MHFLFQMTHIYMMTNKTKLSISAIPFHTLNMIAELANLTTIGFDQIPTPFRMLFVRMNLVISFVTPSMIRAKRIFNHCDVCLPMKKVENILNGQFSVRVSKKVFQARLQTFEKCALKFGFFLGFSHTRTRNGFSFFISSPMQLVLLIPKIAAVVRVTIEEASNFSTSNESRFYRKWTVFIASGSTYYGIITHSHNSLQ